MLKKLHLKNGYRQQRVTPYRPFYVQLLILFSLLSGMLGCTGLHVPPPPAPPPPGITTLPAHGNFEIVARVDNKLEHYWREDKFPNRWFGPNVIPFSQGVSGTPSLIQSSQGYKGNFHVVVPWASGGLAHFWRDNDHAMVWHGPERFGSGSVDAVSLIQTNYGAWGNLEIVARVGNQLVHYWSEDYVNWHGPVVIPGSQGVTGVPSFIQSQFGNKGNFEVVVPSATGGLLHFWRDNDAGMTWHGPHAFGTDNFNTVSLIQSRYGRTGNLEVVANTNNQLVHFWRDDHAPWTWHGPATVDGAQGVSGNPTFIQSWFGEMGDFEVVTPMPGGGMAHFRRDNDGGMVWHGPRTFALNQMAAASLIQSNYSMLTIDSMADFNVIAETDGQLIIGVAYQYYSENGDCIATSAQALDANDQIINDIGYTPWLTHAGPGHAYVELANVFNRSHTSEKIRVNFYLCNGDRFATRTFIYHKDWSENPDDINPVNMRTRSQTSKELNVELKYSLRSQHNVPVRMAAYSLHQGRKSNAHGFAPSAPLAMGEDLKARTKLLFSQEGMEFSDALLFAMYEQGGDGFVYGVVPRKKYWSSNTLDRDFDGISDVNETFLGTNLLSKDTDGDGIHDNWELEGYRFNGYQFTESNLPFFSADPKHKDVFVQVDYLQSSDTFKSDATFRIIPLSPGSDLVLIQSHRYPNRFVTYEGEHVTLKPIQPYSYPFALFRRVSGLANNAFFSFEAQARPGYFLRHQELTIKLQQSDGTISFNKDATFKQETGLADANLMSLTSFNFNNYFIAQDEYQLYLLLGEHKHTVPLASIYKAKELYRNMPIANPDGQNGIALHVYNDDAIPFDMDVGGVCGMDDFVQYFEEPIRRVYHWAIAGHGGGGQAWRRSNRFVFGTGNGVPEGGTATSRSKFDAYSTMTHELGHNLNLKHEGRSGNNQSNCKVNYPSLMNYAYDYSFNCSSKTLTATEIQYSDGSGPSISEKGLWELTNPVSLAYVKGFDSDALGCNAFLIQPVGSYLWIDWNRNGQFHAGGVAVDFSDVAPSCEADEKFQSDQRDSNDFATIENYIDNSIRSPRRSNCDDVGPGTGFQHSQDEPAIQPVCGIQPVTNMREHPWLQINPVFSIKPGMEIKHPTLRHQLAPVLSPQYRIVPDAPIQKRPERKLKLKQLRLRKYELPRHATDPTVRGRFIPSKQ